MESVYPSSTSPLYLPVYTYIDDKAQEYFLSPVSDMPKVHHQKCLVTITCNILQISMAENMIIFR